MAEVADNATRATMAYNRAVEDYGNFVDTTMRQYGWTMPDASGQYSITGAQDAFDPNRVIQYDTTGKPIFDQEAILGQTMGGQYGTTGLFAETAQAAASSEAEARMAARGRNLGRGSGLSRQQELASEFAGQESMRNVSTGLFQDILGKYSGLTRAYEEVGIGEATDALINARLLSENVELSDEVPVPETSVPNASEGPAYTTKRGGFATSAGGDRYTMSIDERKKYTTKATSQQLRAGGVPPTGKPGQVFTGKGGVSYVRRQDGWYIVQ